MAVSVHPVRRDLHFDFDFDRLGDWHFSGPNGSHFMNALSVFFPDGERFFIESVRHYRERGAITDPALLEDVRQFIGQEAMHGREHERYNAALDKRGLAVAAKEKRVKRLLDFIRRNTPASSQLAATCALEHLTATLADGLLRHETAGKRGSDPTFESAWRWHALEETEHKAVAFDVYQRVVGDDSDVRAYRIRIVSHVAANVVFWPLAIAFWLDFSRRSGDLGNLRAWLRALDFLFGRSPGTLRRQFPMWRDYFRRGFHPWQHDNRDFLVEVDVIAGAHAAAA